MTFKISIEEVEYIAHRSARNMMTWDEPIPDFSTRYPNVLESCLAVPFQSFGRKDLYPTFIKKATILFYLMIKNHPFENLPAPQAGEFCVYALECNDGSIYIGQTDNFPRRKSEHDTGLNFWTRSRLPVELKYVEKFKNKSDALVRESKLKTGFGRKWLKKKIKSLATRQAGGNKRLAVTTLIMFLRKNSKWLTVDNQELYNFAVWVASSPAEFREEILSATEKFIKKNLVDKKIPARHIAGRLV